MTSTILLVLLLVPAANGEPGAPAAAESSASDRQVQEEAGDSARFARSEADQWKLSIEGPKRTPLELRPEPVLRWSNPAVGRVYGSVFVWTSQGRPIAAASFYRWYFPYTQGTAEFASLSPEPLLAENQHQKFWAPLGGQVKFQPLSDASAPDPSDKKRAAQMRKLAREFVAELSDRRVVAEGTEQQLRLLDKPVYQYGAGASGLLDGGLFAFVVGTDPEVLLLIEARETETGREWQYALARMNRDALRVRHKGREVWSAPYLENPGSEIGAPYRLIGVRPTTSEK